MVNVGFHVKLWQSFSFPGVEGAFLEIFHILPWDELRLGIPHVSSGEAGERKLYISKDFVWGLGPGRMACLFEWGSLLLFFLG